MNNKNSPSATNRWGRDNAENLTTTLQFPAKEATAWEHDFALFCVIVSFFQNIVNKKKG